MKSSTLQMKTKKTNQWKLASLSLTTLILAASWAVGQDTKAPGLAGLSNDLPCTHNMLVIGKETVFLSHLPMFDGVNAEGTSYTSPHRYQVILEARFSSGGKDVTGVYTADRKSHPRTEMYTLEPKSVFALPDLFGPDASMPAISSFNAAIIRGHLERGGEVIDGLEDVVVTVTRVIRAVEFEPSRKKPQGLPYFLFGTGKELFLAHEIIQPPDFDQILAVKIAGNAFTDEELKRGVRVTFLDRQNVATDRLKKNQKVEGQFHVTGAHQFLHRQVQAGTEYYLEEGELAMPATFDTTPEEKKSGL